MRIVVDSPSSDASPHFMTMPVPDTTPVVCPKCASTSLQVVEVPKVRTALGEFASVALVGLQTTAVTGSLQKAHAVMCLRCGQLWVPGSAQERELRALHGQLGEEAKRHALETSRPVVRKSFGPSFWKIVGALTVGFFLLGIILRIAKN